MPRKVKKEVGPDSSPAPDAQVIGTPAAEPFALEPTSGASSVSVVAAPEEKGNRLPSIPLTDAGAVDWRSVRPKTAEKLRSMVAATPELKQATSGADVMKFSPQVVGMLYGAVGHLEAFIASKKFPADLAQQVFQYSEQELAILTPPTQAVLDKYVAPKVGENAELLAFFGALALIHVQKFQMLSALTTKRLEEEHAAEMEKARARSNAGDGPKLAVR